MEDIQSSRIDLFYFVPGTRVYAHLFVHVQYGELFGLEA